MSPAALAIAAVILAMAYARAFLYQFAHTYKYKTSNIGLRDPLADISKQCKPALCQVRFSHIYRQNMAPF